jgi:hypothetical protein
MNEIILSLSLAWPLRVARYDLEQDHYFIAATPAYNLHIRTLLGAEALCLEHPLMIGVL